jgi:hypothetical protein
MVNTETNNKIMFIQYPKSGLKRISKQTSAVIKVEECTRAKTGVGAAIAAGNQEEKGISALLVIAAKTTRKEINSVSTEHDENSKKQIKLQLPKLIIQACVTHATQHPMHTLQTEIFICHATTILTKCFN